MRTVPAKIIDATHLELLQPLEATTPGDVIQITFASDADDETALWRQAAKQHFLDAYTDEDAAYDDL